MCIHHWCVQVREAHPVRVEEAEGGHEEAGERAVRQVDRSTERRLWWLSQPYGLCCEDQVYCMPVLLAVAMKLLLSGGGRDAMAELIRISVEQVLR